MAVIIDGYNLMMQIGEIRLGLGPRRLKYARQYLLRILAKRLDEIQRRSTTVVFDAKQVPESGVRSENVEGIDVRFAAGYREADDLIEELLKKHPAPKTLAIVSDDRRLQRAAKRRGAAAIDCLQWWEQIKRRGPPIEPLPLVDEELESGDGGLTPEQIEQWLKEFENAGAARQVDAGGTEPTESSADFPIWDPFPPGYGLDVLEEEKEDRQK